MRFVIVTGMSGAGRNTSLRMLEDAGYFCVDNLPISLMGKFSELVYSGTSEITKVALGIDVRNGQALSELQHSLEELTMAGYTYEILFLDASDNVLIKRYKETRRNHPLAGDGRIAEGIERERERLTFLKKQADYIIDTSSLLTRELKLELDKIFVQNREFRNLVISVLSFGFKFGIPNDADLVFDVRFLPNPYYIPELKPQTGNDRDVYEYVMDSEQAGVFLKQLYQMLQFLIPNYILEGKNQIVISIGCTGGKHRSVTIANALGKKMKELPYSLKVEHRDIEKDAILKK